MYLHSKSASMQSSSRFDARDSGIELLRIIAMFVILAHHFVVHNASPVNRLPFGPTKLLMHFFLVGSGKASVVIFFAITAWFLLDGAHSLRKNCRSAWLLDRQVIFYSVFIAVFGYSMGFKGGVLFLSNPSSRFRLIFGGIRPAMSCS